MGWFLKTATSHIEKLVNSLILQELKTERLVNYTEIFEKVGENVFGEHKETTSKRYKKTEHCKSNINSIDMDYDADDSTFISCIYKLNTPVFNKVHRSVCRNRMDFKQYSLEVFW